MGFLRQTNFDFNATIGIRPLSEVTSNNRQPYRKPTTIYFRTILRRLKIHPQKQKSLAPFCFNGKQPA